MYNLRFSDRLLLIKGSDNFFRIVLHQFDSYIICSHQMNIYGYFCPTCNINQPFNDWWCDICGSPSIMGEPGWKENENQEFDKYFETDRELVLKKIKKTRFGNFLYKRI